MYVILFSLIYIQTTNKKSICLDKDGSFAEMSDSISLTECHSVTLINRPRA